MKQTAFVYRILADVKLTKGEVAQMMKVAESHYDGKCREFGAKTLKYWHNWKFPEGSDATAETLAEPSSALATKSRREYELRSQPKKDAQSQGQTLLQSEQVKPLRTKPIILLIGRPFVFFLHPSQNLRGIIILRIIIGVSQTRKGSNGMYKIEPPIDMNGYDIALLDASAKYGNGTMAVQTFTTDGEPACTVSVNMVNDAHKLGEGEFFVKGWSENELPVAKLIERGIIVIVEGKSAKSGYVTAKVGKLNLTALKAE